MRCGECEVWLLTARAESDVPADVRQHVAECRMCSTTWQQALTVDAGIRSLSDADDRAAIARLEATLDRMPRAAPVNGRTTRLWQRIAWGFAAAGFLTIGWLGGRFFAPSVPSAEQRTPPSREREPVPEAKPVESSPAYRLLVRLATPAGNSPRRPPWMRSPLAFSTCRAVLPSSTDTSRAHRKRPRASKRTASSEPIRHLTSDSIHDRNTNADER